MSDHPSQDELTALERGDLPAARASLVLRHLVEGCDLCLSLAPPQLARFLGREPLEIRPDPADEAARAAAIRRAFDRARKHARHLDRERDQASRAVAALAAGERMEDVARRTRGLALYEALLARSWELRHEDPATMIRYAWLATRIAATLSIRRYGQERIADLQCRAWAELANAQRAADKLDLAEESLAQAVELYSRGTSDQFLGVRLLELQAALAADRRRFGLASKALSLVYRFYRRHSHARLTGRTLVSWGLYMGYAGETEEAVRLLRKSLSFIDESVDPSLAFAAVHNQILFLVDAGNFREARKVLFQNRRYLQDANAGGKLNHLKQAWLEGRIDAGLGRHTRAEQIFDRVRNELQAAGLPFQAAIASLDLAAVLLILERAAEAQDVVVEAARVFSALRIEREALGAMLMLRQSFEVRAATVSFVEEVAAFLRRVEQDPTARFDPR